nr:hypothetical protein [Hymenobacter sp.]
MTRMGSNVGCGSGVTSRPRGCYGGRILRIAGGRVSRKSTLTGF